VLHIEIVCIGAADRLRRRKVASNVTNLRLKTSHHPFSLRAENFAARREASRDEMR
jgi:hypothetical protein